jgi:hypothetical protein
VVQASDWALVLVPALASVSALALVSVLVLALVLVALAEALHRLPVAVVLASWLEQALASALALVQPSHLPRPISTDRYLFQ